MSRLGPSRQLVNNPPWAIRLTLVLGGLVTLAATQYVRERESKLAAAAFRDDASRVASAIERRAWLAETSVHFLRGLFEGSEVVTREEFATFAASLLERNTSVRALQWAARVPPTDGAGNDRFPVTFVAPAAVSEWAIGLDLAEETVRAQALARARDQSGLVATAPLWLDPEARQEVGVLLVLPYYGKQAPATVEGRRTALLGFLVAAVTTADLIAPSLRDPGNRLMNVTAVDPAASASPALYAATNSPPASATSSSGSIRFLSELVVGARTWRIECLPTEAYLASHLSATPLLTALGGVLLTAFAAVLMVRERRIALRLWHAAYHDSLTGLPNRSLFVDALAEMQHRVAHGASRPSAVLFLDLDRFKLINDSLGHAAGDEVLRAVAARLTKLLPAGEMLARIGGDEFALLLEGAEVEAAKRFADRIRDAMNEPLPLVSGGVSLGLSIGIAVLDQSYPGVDMPSDLLRDADIAMYRAKLARSQGHVVFDRSMRDAIVRNQSLEQDLRSAIQGGQLSLYYQPIVALASGRLSGFEALVRWQHPAEGVLLPEEFIGLAEESGLIRPVGDWVLDRACERLAAWQRLRPGTAERAPLRLQVNVSSRQINAPGLVSTLERALRSHALAPRDLTLEITESVLLGAEEPTMRTLQQIRDHEVSVCLDDFGTGFSSLSYLHRLPVDGLKIDKSFVTRLGSTERDASFVRSILAMGAELGLGVTVEGVETAEQLALLREMGCRYAQGYLFSPPLSEAEAEQMLIRDPCWNPAP